MYDITKGQSRNEIASGQNMMSLPCFTNSFIFELIMGHKLYDITKGPHFLAKKKVKIWCHSHASQIPIYSGSQIDTMKEQDQDLQIEIVH